MSASNLRPAVIDRRKAFWREVFLGSPQLALTWEGNLCWIKESRDSNPNGDSYAQLSRFGNVRWAEEYTALAESLEEYRNDPTVKT